MSTSTNIIERGTLYFGGGYAYRRTEARQISHQIGPDAQFAQAIRLTFTHKGRRKPSKKVLTGGQLVILAGWGHPIPPEIWSEGTQRGPIPTEWGTVTATSHHPRYPLLDKRWITEFDAFLDDYLSRSGAQVLLDFRNHDFKDDFGPHFGRHRRGDMMTDKPSFQRIKNDISENDIVLYMIGNMATPRHGFSAMVGQTLSRLGIKDFKTVDVLADPELCEGIKEFSKWPTIPQLFVKGEFVGGFDIVQEMFKTGALKEFLISKGILPDEAH